jgi:hypothetical protein
VKTLFFFSFFLYFLVSSSFYSQIKFCFFKRKGKDERKGGREGGKEERKKGRKVEISEL